MLQSTAVVLLAMFWASLYLLDSFIKVALTGVPTFSYSSVNDYTVSQKKNIPDIFSYNSRKHCWIFIIFGTHVTEKVGNQ